MPFTPLHRLLCICTAVLLLAAGGCSTFSRNDEKKAAQLLTPASTSADNISLEVVFLRVPARELELHDDLWNEVDEQQLPLETRRGLLANGIRAGVIGTQLPESLRKLLEAGPDPGEDNLQAAEPWQKNRNMQVTPGSRSEIIASGIYPSLTPLFLEDGRLSGKTRGQAQCLLGLLAFPQNDGRVRLELMPEIHFGQPHQRYVGSGGVYRLESGRDRDVYDSLRLECPLSPGESLLLAATPARAGLGRAFFTDLASGDQRLLLIRLAQAPNTDLYTTAEVPDAGLAE